MDTRSSREVNKSKRGSGVRNVEIPVPQGMRMRIMLEVPYFLGGVLFSRSFRVVWARTPGACESPGLRFNLAAC